MRQALTAIREDNLRQIWLHSGAARQESFAAFKQRVQANTTAVKETREDILAKVQRFF